jgi:beta-glucosidase
MLLTSNICRTIAAWYHLRQDKDFPTPGIGMPAHIGGGKRKPIDARDPDTRQILLDGAVEGHVLLKHTKDTLPLKAPRQLSIFGYSAKSPDVFAPVAGNVDSYTWNFGAEAVAADEVHAGFAGERRDDFSVVGFGGTLIHGGGSGATAPAAFLSPFEALKMRAIANNTAIFHDFDSPGPLVSSASDACLVFGNAWASEGYDRPALRDDYTDGLIKSVADQCNKTIVVLHNAGPRLVDQFFDHPNVSALIFAHLPGQETGSALVSLLYGEENFSGKLPYTVARNESDYGRMLGPDVASDEYVNFPQSDFDEGVYIDYRHFDKEGIKPRYEFGFGMSYTTFEISDLSLNKSNTGDWDEWPSGEVVPGGQSDLWDILVTVEAGVKNTGDVAGAEVAQLYLGIPNSPSKQLRGFEKPYLEPDEDVRVSFEVTRRDLSVWDPERQRWHLQRGRYTVFLGSSSRQLPLSDTFTI